MILSNIEHEFILRLDVYNILNGVKTLNTSWFCEINISGNINGSPTYVELLKHPEKAFCLYPLNRVNVIDLYNNRDLDMDYGVHKGNYTGLKEFIMPRKVSKIPIYEPFSKAYGFRGITRFAFPEELEGDQYIVLNDFFSNCSLLTEVVNLDTFCNNEEIKVASTDKMFYNCSSLQQDFSDLTMYVTGTSTNMFNGSGITAAKQPTIVKV